MEFARGGPKLSLKSTRNFSGIPPKTPVDFLSSGVVPLQISSLKRVGCSISQPILSVVFWNNISRSQSLPFPTPQPSPACTPRWVKSVFLHQSPQKRKAVDQLDHLMPLRMNSKHRQAVPRHRRLFAPPLRIRPRWWLIQLGEALQVRMDLKAYKVCFFSPLFSSQALLPCFVSDVATMLALRVLACFSPYQTNIYRISCIFLLDFLHFRCFLSGCSELTLRIVTRFPLHIPAFYIIFGPLNVLLELFQ